MVVRMERDSAALFGVVPSGAARLLHILGRNWSMFED